MKIATLFVLVAAAAVVRMSGAEMSKCHDGAGQGQRCMPSFVNAAYGRRVVASNTCGTPAEEYCLQTGRRGVTKSCHICDASRAQLSHNAEYLTDLSEDLDAEEGTWWQSNSMIYDVQHPSMVNLTLNLSESCSVNSLARARALSSAPRSGQLRPRRTP